MSSYITFRMGERDLAATLDQVAEVIRAAGIEPLAGSRAPVSGLLELRGQPLPVVDLRSDAYPGQVGDIVVLAPGDHGWLGLAVDRVLAVASPEELVLRDGPRQVGLPAYVTDVLHTTEEEPRPVFAVDLWALAGVLGGNDGTSGETKAGDGKVDAAPA